MLTPGPVNEKAARSNSISQASSNRKGDKSLAGNRFGKNQNLVLRDLQIQENLMNLSAQVNMSNENKTRATRMREVQISAEIINHEESKFA